MSACIHCGTANPESAAFCRGCGRPLLDRRICPACGHRNSAGSRFCNHCGNVLKVEGPTAIVQPVADSSSPPTWVPSSGTKAASPGEWAELTRLVGDLVDGGVVPFPLDEPALPDAVEDESVATAMFPHSGLAIAECVTGNGPGLELSLNPPQKWRFDGEKSIASMANAVPMPQTSTRAPRRRPSWHEPRG